MGYARAVPRPSRVVLAGIFALGCGSALWVLWGPVIARTADGGSLERCIKDFYAPDQYAVLGIARNARDGLPVYSDPYSALGESFYPGEYYRLLGDVAAGVDTSVVWSWNVVGLLVSCLLIALSWAWARRLAPGTSAWVLAPLPFLLGTLTWWLDGTWLYQSDDAVLWPPFASLYTGGAEPPALLLVGLSLLALLTALGAAGRRRLAWAAGAGAALGLSLQVHANIFVFGLVAAALVLAWDELLGTAGRTRRRVAAGGAAALLLAGALLPQSGAGTRLAVLLAAIAGLVGTDARWRRARGPLLAAGAAAALLASMPLSARLAVEALSGEGYLYERQQSVGEAGVDLPLLAVALLWLPLWLLAGAAMRRLAQRRDPAAHPAWLPTLAGLTTATLLLAIAGWLGAEGLEWHRFLIYGAFLTATAAAPALWLILRDGGDRRGQLVGVAAAACLAATLPTVQVFVDGQAEAVACVPRQEAEAYAAIGRAAGPDRVLLLDRCMDPGAFRVHSGARTLYVNQGIAAPEDLDGLVGQLALIRAGILPGEARMRELGATSFLTNTLCAGVSREQIAARLGPPVATVPLRDVEAFGLPPGFAYRYELYDVPAVRRGPARADSAAASRP